MVENTIPTRRLKRKKSASPTGFPPDFFRGDNFSSPPFGAL
jgi:hypothetical protein